MKSKSMPGDDERGSRRSCRCRTARPTSRPSSSAPRRSAPGTACESANESASIGSRSPRQLLEAALVEQHVDPVAHAQPEVVVALGADVQVALQALVVDERLAGRAAAPLGGRRAARCGGDLSHVAHPPRLRRRSASVASISRSTSSPRRRRLERQHEGRRLPARDGVLRRGLRAELGLEVREHAGACGRPCRSRPPRGRARAPRSLLAARELGLDHALERADLVLGQVHDLRAAGRTPPRPRRAARSRAPARPRRARRAALVGVGLGHLAGGRERLLGLAQRPVHVDQRDRRRRGAGRRGRPPARASTRASSRLPAWNAVWPSAVSGDLVVGLDLEHLAEGLVRLLACGPRRPARRRGRATPRRSRAGARPPSRSWSTASSAPVSTPARPASRSSSTSSGDPLSPRRRAGPGRTPCLEMGPGLLQAVIASIFSDRARESTPASPIAGCRRPTGAGSRLRTRRSSTRRVVDELELVGSIGRRRRARRARAQLRILLAEQVGRLGDPLSLDHRALPRPWMPLVWRQSSE